MEEASMRFTRSECPDCTKEVLMTHVREEKRRLADSTSVESLVIRLFRLASAAPPPGPAAGEARELWQSACGSASRSDSSVTFSVRSNATRSQQKNSRYGLKAKGVDVTVGIQRACNNLFVHRAHFLQLHGSGRALFARRYRQTIRKKSNEVYSDGANQCRVHSTKSYLDP